MNWYRTHHGMWSDPKLALVARRAGSNLPMAIAVWTALLDCASQARRRGDIDGFDAEAVAFALGAEAEEVEALLSAMQAKGMVEEGQIVRWEESQRSGDFGYERAQARARFSGDIFARDEFCCVYCGAGVDSVELTIDHVVPLSRGGANDPENLATACRSSNRAKGARTPEEWRGSDALG